MTEYHCISMDPPWPESGGGKIKRGADRHYALLKVKDIPQVIYDCPLWRPAKDCHLWIWATNNHLPAGLWLMTMLGFRYITNIAWVKGEVLQDGMYYKLDRPGLGQYTMGQHELLLFGSRGKTMKPAEIDRPRTVIIAPRRAHSQKPEEAYQLIEKVSPGPRLELFARAQRENWNVWGDEVIDASNENHSSGRQCIP